MQENNQALNGVLVQRRENGEYAVGNSSNWDKIETYLMETDFTVAQWNMVMKILNITLCDGFN